MQYSWSRARCVYEFFIRPVPPLPLSPGTFPPPRRRPPTILRETVVPTVVCEETHVRATIDEIDLLRASPRGKPALKEEREKKAEPLGRSRSYESYASVSAADRIKNLGEKEPVRPSVRESFVPFSSPAPERRRFRVSSFPLSTVPFVKLKQQHATFVTKRRSRAIAGGMFSLSRTMTALGEL